MSNVFTSARYLTVLLFVLGFIIFTNADVTISFFWKRQITKILPIALCPSEEDFRTCFNTDDKGCRKCFHITELECRDATAFAGDACMNQFEESIPFFIRRSEIRAYWDEVLKECVLEEFENALEDKHKPIEICSDKSEENCLVPGT